MKREVKLRPTCECRFDERLNTKVEEPTLLVHTGLVGELEHLKIKTRLIDEKFLSVISSIFKLIRKAVALARVLPTFAFNYSYSCAENAVRRKWKIQLVGCAS
jgi:hypothetical protein